MAAPPRPAAPTADGTTLAKTGIGPAFALGNGGSRAQDPTRATVQTFSRARKRVEEHTDNVPVPPALQGRYRTNWELSSARALAVLHALGAEPGVQPQRLAAVGLGEHHPVGSNANAAGRAQNRRVVIVIGDEKRPDVALR